MQTNRKIAAPDLDSVEVRNYLRRALVGEADRDDLFQDTYVRFAMAARVNEIRNEIAYKKSIARRTVSSFYRKRKTLREVGLPPNQVDGAKGPAETAQVSETCAILYAAIRELPSPYREVVELHFLEELPLRSVAAVLAKKDETVRKQLERAICQLRKKASLARLHVP